MEAKRIIGAAAIVAALSLAGCGGATTAQSQAAAAAGSPQQAAGAPSSSNFAAGQVKQVNGNTIQVSTAMEVLPVKVSDQTQIQKTVAGSLIDIKAGETVMVRGTRASDGTLAAQTIQIGARLGGAALPPAGAPDMPPPGAGDGSGQGGQPPAGMPTRGAGGAGGRAGFDPNNSAMGEVKQVDGSTIQVSTADKVVTVNVSDQTQFQKTIQAALTDITVGERITAQGTRGSDGVFVAQAIQVGGGFGGGGAGTPQPAAATPASN